MLIYKKEGDKVKNNLPLTELEVYDIQQPKEKLTFVSARAFCSLSIRTKGVVKIKIDRNELVSEAGCITFIPKGKSYYTQVVKDTRMVVIHFNTQNGNLFDGAFVTKNAAPVFEQLFDKVLKSHSVASSSNFECYSYFYRLLFELEKHFAEAQKGKINPVILKAKAEIEEKYKDNNFNIDTLVRSLGISSSYLRREFHKYYSYSPVKYLKNVRLQNALSLLASDYYSIDEIASQSGYSSASYFIQSFHSAMGCSPLKYKEKSL